MASRRSILKHTHPGAEPDLSQRELPKAPLVKAVSFADDVQRFEYIKPFESEEEELAWEAEQAILRAREVVARAKADYFSGLDDDLDFKAGDIIEDIVEEEGGWWSGSLNGKRGVFPSTYVKFIPKELALQLNMAEAARAAASTPGQDLGSQGESDDSQPVQGLKLFDVEPSQLKTLSFGALAFDGESTDDGNSPAPQRKAVMLTSFGGSTDDLDTDDFEVQVKPAEVTYAGLSAANLQACREKISLFEKQESTESLRNQPPTEFRSRRGSILTRDGSIRRPPSPPPPVQVPVANILKLSLPADEEVESSSDASPERKALSAVAGWKQANLDTLRHQDQESSSDHLETDTDTDAGAEANPTDDHTRDALAAVAGWKQASNEAARSQDIPERDDSRAEAAVAVAATATAATAAHSPHQVASQDKAKAFVDWAHSNRDRVNSTSASDATPEIVPAASAVEPPRQPPQKAAKPEPPTRAATTKLTSAAVPSDEDKLREVETQPWYHGSISRRETEDLFLEENGQEGWFLVRKSTRADNTFVLSLCYDEHLYHNQIFFQNSKFESPLGGVFDSLKEMVDKHRADEGGFQAPLSTPCRRRDRPT